MMAKKPAQPVWITPLRAPISLPLPEDKLLRCPTCQQEVGHKFNSGDWSWTLSHKGEEHMLYPEDYKNSNFDKVFEWLRSIPHIETQQARTFGGYFRRAA